jgi:transmembrane sensor
MIEFEGMPLGDAVAAFNRTSARAIAVEDASARALRVTGAFRRDDPEGFAAALAATFGLKVRREADARLALVGAPPAAAKKP